MNVLQELFGNSQIPNYIHPFTRLAPEDTKESIEHTLLDLKAAGLRSANYLWENSSQMAKLEPFNSDIYWERISWVVEACKKHNMTFMLQDAAPFPTGCADGWFQREEYHHLNKLYLAERHIDVKGPVKEGTFLVSELMSCIRGGDSFGQEIHLFPGDRLIAVVAMRRDDELFDPQTAVDLTAQVQDGILFWNVPKGIWRIFIAYETFNGEGRPYYMNLLDKDSVALNIQAVHEPHYRHLKEELGKTWVGFFYDEPEVGNIDGYWFDAVPGTPCSHGGYTMSLPWSHQMETLCKEEWGDDYRLSLPLLWYKDKTQFHHIRYQYMDIISKLIRENYNGQMHLWCLERGIPYIGHTLEDENSHCRLSSGPVHFFRTQAHQDSAGVDLIAGQLVPGKDFPQAWYGSQDGDGEFYHYGLAKLASSAGNISPSKNGRSFCEVFAVYGAMAGSRMRKFLIDHLFVNGINELIPASPYIMGVDRKYSRRENLYANRMCHLMHRTRNVIKVALLYHAESEWYQGTCQMFQVPGHILAQNQISYDVIPADVFSDTMFYQTDCSHGLTINGNRYEALVIPASDALPLCVFHFLKQAEATGFPVLFCDSMPCAIAENGTACTPSYGTCIPVNTLAQTLNNIIQRDFISDTFVPAVRYAHFHDNSGEYYFLHNEGDSVQFTARIPFSLPMYRIELDKMLCFPQSAKIVSGHSVISIEMAEYEAILFYIGNNPPALSYDTTIQATEAKEISGTWQIRLDNGTSFETDTLVNINGANYFPRYTGSISYDITVTFDKIPVMLDLGHVYEICTVYCNGKEAGTCQFSPYRVSLEDCAVVGENHIHIDVLPNIIHAGNRSGAPDESPILSMMAGIYNTLEPGGLLGPVIAYC